MDEKTKKRIFVFIDTNLVYSKEMDYNIFRSNFLNQIIILRNFFSERIESTEILLILPYTVVRERYKQKYDLLYKEMDEIIKKLKLLQKKDFFKTDITIKELEKNQKNLEKKIERAGNDYLKSNSILITSDCPAEFFERIKNKAYTKEKPFDNKEIDGFKDALIWYSLINYLKTQNISKNDHIFLFTNNSRDFKSDNTLKEFKAIFGTDIKIISRESKNFQICASENQEFLQFTLQESKGIEILNIFIEYIEKIDKVKIEKIIANPFPTDLSPIIIPYQLNKENWKKEIEKRTIDLLKSLNFKVDTSKITFNYSLLPNIFEITVFLDFHEEGYFYDINSFEISFEDGDIQEIEIGSENYLILDDYIIDYQSPDFTFFSIEPRINIIIAEILENLIGREVDPDTLIYTILR
ncbi:MAG: PIN domain-containing protein [Methanoregula sp.]